MPIAGSTGATTANDVWRPSDERVDGQHEGGDTYSVQFIQLTSDASENSSLTLMDSSIRVYVDDRPSSGFALKQGGAKRVTFSKEQKDIMISFYD